MTSIQQVRRLNEFIRAVNRCVIEEWHEKGPIWFRGQALAEWPLEPKQFRYKRPDETALRVDFRRLGMEMISGSKPADHWEWYFLAQHFGLPTRLLDWTESALFALYFAVREHSVQRDGNAAVWILDPKWLNERAGVGPYIALPTLDFEKWLPKEPEGEIKATMPLALAPSHVTRRVAVQRSQFVLFGQDHTGLSELESAESSKLRRLEIGRNDAAVILNELKVAGIWETTLFPDLEGLARELVEKYAGPKKTSS